MSKHVHVWNTPVYLNMKNFQVIYYFTMYYNCCLSSILSCISSTVIITNMPIHWHYTLYTSFDDNMITEWSMTHLLDRTTWCGRQSYWLKSFSICSPCSSVKHIDYHPRLLQFLVRHYWLIVPHIVPQAWHFSSISRTISVFTNYTWNRVHPLLTWYL